MTPELTQDLSVWSDVVYAEYQRLIPSIFRRLIAVSSPKNSPRLVWEDTKKRVFTLFFGSYPFARWECYPQCDESRISFHEGIAVKNLTVPRRIGKVVGTFSDLSGIEKDLRATHRFVCKVFDIKERLEEIRRLLLAEETTFSEAEKERKKDAYLIGALPHSPLRDILQQHWFDTFYVPLQISTINLDNRSRVLRPGFSAAEVADVTSVVHTVDKTDTPVPMVSVFLKRREGQSESGFSEIASPDLVGEK